MRILILVEDAASTGRVASASRVADLAHGLVALGTDVRVLAPEAGAAQTPRSEDVPDLTRVADYPPMIPRWDRMARTIQHGIGLFERGIASLMREPADLIHAHDWTAAYAAVGLRRTFRVPLVTTLHSTQVSRRGKRYGGRGDELITEVERWLASESARVIVRSPGAARQVRERFGLQAARIEAVPAPRNRGELQRRLMLAGRITRIYEEVLDERIRRRVRLEDGSSHPALRGTPR